MTMVRWQGRRLSPVIVVLALGAVLQIDAQRVAADLATDSLGLVAEVGSDTWRLSHEGFVRTVRAPWRLPAGVFMGAPDGSQGFEARSEGFLIRLGDGTEVGPADFEWDREPVCWSAEEGVYFHFEGRSEPLGLAVRMGFDVEGVGAIRKRIGLRVIGDQPVLVRDTQVERAEVRGEVELGGLGQPLFINGTAIWALAYPAADNLHADGFVTLGHHPGRWLEPGDDWWYSKQAVCWLEPGKTAEEAFRTYLGSIRRPPRPYVVYNSWYDLQGAELTPEALIDRARRIHQELTVKRGAPFDGIVIDDGWQNRRSIWEINRDLFPDGFAPLSEALDPMGVSVDLWHPLTAVDGNLDATWGAANGFETAPDSRFFCLSGPKYNQSLRDELRRHVGEYDIDYLKHDFNAFACAADGHGHLPEAVYGREANVDAELEMFHFLNQLNPEVYLNPSGGMWLSPWWLRDVGTVWMQHCADFGYNKEVVAYEPRDWAMTYRDTMLYRNLHVDRAQFPVSAIMTIGIIDGKRNRLGGEHEPLDRWANNVMVNVGRGSMLKELYITPDLLSDTQWDILASATLWQHRFLPQMASGRMLPIDPRWPEVYGWVHLDEDGGFVCLRNAGIVGRHVSVALPELNPDRFYITQRTYPWLEDMYLRATENGLQLEAELEPFGVTVVEVGGREQPFPAQRSALVAREGGLLTYDVWGLPGTRVARVNRTAEGRPAEWIAFPGEPYHLWNAEQSDDGRSFGVTVDEGVEWRFCVVARDLPKATGLSLEVDREPVEASRIEGEGWVMFACMLPKGRHTVSWAAPASAPAQPFSARQYTVETYFVREAQLVPVRVTVKLKPGTYVPQPMPETPCANTERSTWIGPNVTVTPDGSPLDVAVSAEDLTTAQAAKLHIAVFGSQGGDDHGRKWVVLNSERVGFVPANTNAQQPDRWEEFTIDLTPDQVKRLHVDNEVVIETGTADCFKLAGLALSVQLADGRWAETEHSSGVWCSAGGWLYEEGTVFSGKTPPVRLSFRQ